MSSGFPIAAATVAFADRLHLLIGDSVPGARVTTLNPSSESLRSGDPIVNLYLFRTVRNGFVSNDDLPTRGAAGKPLASPTLKLDLDYMITFFGDDAKLDPQRLLGLVAGGLNAQPYIAPDMLRSAIASTPWLGAAGGSDPPCTRISVAPLNMPPDAMARLWSEFVNVPYQLTQLYTATPVTLEVTLPVEPVLPVRRIGLRAVPSRAIAILSLVNATDPSLPPLAGGLMGIRLVNPGQPDLIVRLNGIVAEGVKAGFDADGFAVLLVDLSERQSAPLAVGPLTVQVIRTGADGAGIVAESQIVTTAIVPAFAQPPAVDKGQLVMIMALPVAPEAAAVVLLFPRGASKLPSRRIPCLPRTAPSASLTAPLAGVPAGRYLISVEVDGVATLLDFSGEAYTGPVVDVPAAG
ncbi:Pvc16 family protein [Sphingomonas sp. DT-207]|uniref:Pvc16 family protein n=1 Tax=Sphingomonas sp. DT-207 TaxID=3396167 RepID=UPI003F1B89D5